MIVEFVGRSGVGKTTIARKVSERLVQRGVDNDTEFSMRPRKLAIRNCSALLPALALTCRVVHSNPRHRVDAWGKLVRAMARNAQWVGEVCHPLINSQGLFQVFSYLRIRERLSASEEGTAEAMGRLPARFLPNLVVQVVATPRNMAVRRNLHRAGANLGFELKLAKTDPIPGILTALQPLVMSRGHPFQWVQVKNDLPEHVNRCVAEVESAVLSGISGAQR